MTGKKEEYNFRTKKSCFDRLCMLSVIAAVAVCLTACSSKETVQLEEDDLVRATDISAGDDRTAGTQWIEPSQTGGAAEAQWQTERMPEGQPEIPADSMSAEGAESVDARTMEQVEPSTLFVHICGEVKEPGVYELPVGSRIFDAVEAAGGFTQEAAESYVNLAQELADGWKVEIPATGTEELQRLSESVERGNGSGQEGSAGYSANGTGTAVFGAGSMAGITESMAGTAGEKKDTGEETDGLVNINTATKQELCTLPGVGESRAESIISYREKNGGFERIEDIMKVEGIKEGMFSKIKDKICVRGGK